MNSLMADLRANALEVSRSLRCLTYRIPITCVHCGHHLTHRANGTTTGRAARALADCPNCGHVHMIETTVTTVPGRPIAVQRQPPVPRRTDAQIEHGTERGYHQHRHVSPPCPACKAAHAANERTRTRKAP